MMADESQSRNAMTNSSLLKRNRSALVDITNTITTRSRAAKEQSKVSVATREEVKEILARDDMVMSPNVCDSSLLDDTETTMRNSDLVIAHDQSNRNNTDGCGEYAIEIFEHLINTERRLSPSFNYMEQVQHDINPTMRGILIDWLVEVAEEYKLSSENLFLSTNYVDRFLSVMPVLRSKLQLVGVTCMLIASKYEEINAPQVEDFVYITDSTYSAQEVLQMEVVILHALKFNLTAVTPHNFLTRLCSLLNHDQQTKHLCEYLTEITIQEFQYLKYRPSVIAASAVCLGMHTVPLALSSLLLITPVAAPQRLAPSHVPASPFHVAHRAWRAR
ncbi:hypothetical protein GUITHDRAFT_85274 [Guillardia theta CCMP2712]|uniref:Cyclin N-terminal domain-containing protein n=1 Tax=Guillardia theta (strain CCMP2712) TaxID=905079 RepID=L1JR09_GUITC|nr:hypothetical protein GUITHDRAFT_85274 [Guillardia theta CCMP2712]EKX51001.1 hypothetical protein GUITHDRAFT_85274 [Guillardia theta CCMP2712]|eukprot:XP_005837981.1 hypothetical protein GUITHDRAFT_85274 [Guillardia theta CCMP2712]